MVTRPRWGVKHIVIVNFKVPCGGLGRRRVQTYLPDAVESTVFTLYRGMCQANETSSIVPLTLSVERSILDASIN